MSDREDDDSSDERPPVRAPRARSIGGAIEDTGRRPRYEMGGDERARGGFRSRDTARLDAVPEETADSVEDTAGVRLGRHNRQLANRVLELEAAVMAAAPAEASAGTRRSKARIERVIEGVVTAIVGIVLAWLGDSYHTARGELAEQHDHLITLEQRVSQLERTLGAVVVPRITPSLYPGPWPGKDPSP